MVAGDQELGFTSEIGTWNTVKLCSRDEKCNGMRGEKNGGGERYFCPLSSAQSQILQAATTIVF